MNESLSAEEKARLDAEGASGKSERRRAAPDATASLLAAYELDHLPETFAMRDGDGGVIQERDACYLCRADGFYGRGTHGTHYVEGSIIVTDVVPNQHMEPLNRAAAIKTAQWLDRLPKHQVPVDMGDISEAMTMLAARPDFLTMTPEERSEAAMKFAVRLKMKREGKDARDLPAIAHNFAPVSGGNAPPILGAKMSDMAQRRPGETRAAVAMPGAPSGVRRAALGGVPPGR